MKKIAYYGLAFMLAALWLLGGQAAAEESVCHGYEGPAHGLCNAYCDAMDCDSDAHHASEKACEVIYRRFEKQTGDTPPCEKVGCPAWDSGELDLMWTAYESRGYMDDQVLKLPHNTSGLMWGDANVYNDENYVYANIQWFPSLLAVYGEVRDGVVLQKKEWLLNSFDEYRACRDLLIQHSVPVD